MARKKMIFMDIPETYIRLLNFIPSHEKELRDFIELKIAEFRDPYAFNFSGYAKLFEQRSNYIKSWNLLKEHSYSEEDFRDMEGVSISTLNALIREGFIKSKEIEVPVLRTETYHIYSL